MNDPNPSEIDPLDLLAEEYLERLRRGERPALAEYVERHPELADRIRALLPTFRKELPGSVDLNIHRDRSQSIRSCAAGCADNGAFLQRRIQHALTSELAQQALGHAERPAPRVLLSRSSHAAGNVFAQDDDPGISPHLLSQCFIQRHADGDPGLPRRPLGYHVVVD